MSRRARGLMLAGALAAAALGGCRSPAPEEGRAARDPERQRVLEFWKQHNAATAARAAGDLAEAARLYDAALGLDPRHEDALYYLGQCRRELREPEAARAAFERLVEVNPLSVRGQLALGALLASPEPAEPMDLAQAERHLLRAHEINGEETGPLVRLGEIALVTGRMAEARHWLESALRSNPKSLEAAFLAGYLGWTEGRDPAPLARRVQEAARVEAPTHGVLSEGDRRDAQSRVAPPLANPVGRLLFEAPIEALRAHATDSGPPAQQDIVAQWRAVERLAREHARRAAAATS